MNVCLISHDTDLKASFDRIDHFESVMLRETIEGLHPQDVVVIDEHVCPYNDFSIWINESHLPIQTFYMIRNQDPQIHHHIESLCEANRVHTVPHALTADQVARRVLHLLFPESNDHDRHVATFFGADSKVGTTMVIQTCTEMLSQMSDAKIALFHCNERPGLDYIQAQGNGLDEMKVKLANDILQPEELQEACVKVNQFYFLPGPEHILDVRHFHPEYIDRLLHISKNVFDVILIDAGSNLDNGMTVAALNATKNRFLVTTQQETAKRQYERMESQVFKQLQLRSEDFSLILNKYMKSSGLYDPNTLADLYHMPLATYLPFLDMLGWQAEFDGQSLLQYDQEDYEDQVRQLVRYLGSKMGVPLQEQPRKKGWLQRMNIRGLFS